MSDDGNRQAQVNKLAKIIARRVKRKRYEFKQRHRGRAQSDRVGTEYELGNLLAARNAAKNRTLPAYRRLPTNPKKLRRIERAYAAERAEEIRRQQVFGKVTYLDQPAEAHG